MVVSNIFYFHPYVGKIPNLTNIFQMGWNHHLARCLICVRCLLISFNEILETLWRSAVNFPSTNYQDFGVVRFVFSRFCSKMVPVTETTKRNDSNMLWYHVSWWLQISFIFTPNYLGKWFPFDLRIFFKLGWFEKPPTSCLGGGFKHFLFSPLFGEGFQFD